MRRLRVHPGVAIAAIAALVILAIAAQHYGHDGTYKLLAIAAIFWLLGVKLRRVLPIT